jgi:hypothetical protein
MQFMYKPARPSWPWGQKGGVLLAPLCRLRQGLQPVPEKEWTYLHLWRLSLGLSPAQSLSQAGKSPNIYEPNLGGFGSALVLLWSGLESAST